MPTSTSFLPCVITPNSFQAWPFSAKHRHSANFFSYSRILLPCLTYIYLLTLYFYAIRSMKMFLKVLNKVISEPLHKRKLFLIIDLISFAKLLELLAINQSSSERRIIFVPRLLKFSHFPAFKLNNAILFSTLSRMPGFLQHSSKWTRRFGRFLQYTSGLKVLACSLNTYPNYLTTMLQLHPSLNHCCGNF